MEVDNPKFISRTIPASFQHLLYHGKMQASWSGGPVFQSCVCHTPASWPQINKPSESLSPLLSSVWNDAQKISQLRLRAMS